MDNSTLAILGGNPVRRKPFPKWPFFDADEVEAVSRVLESGNVNYWTGNECRAFEAEFSEYVGRKFAITLANGTLALELALHALDVGPGDEVIVPSRTFIATASSVVAREQLQFVAMLMNIPEIFLWTVHAPRLVKRRVPLSLFTSAVGHARWMRSPH